MKRGYIPWLILLLLATLMGGMIMGMLKKRNEQKEAMTNAESIPALKLKSSLLKKQQPTKLNNGKKTVFVYLNSECDYCQYEINQISKHQGAFNKINLFFLFSESDLEMTSLLKKSTLSNIIIPLQVSPEVAFNEFGFKVFPSISIYDSEGNLIVRYSGETKISTVLKYL